ncbi:hypothetical protein K443DRAFT_547852 [Laccaria amethystina LaAM-08-1]|uniref:Uncharacterized protein n=1 Tax=Laccaria amethystina LaAM-08-1 TaxID=1095629 RepID=A0A0C9WSH8_9AGAR|nr:hypothetical protein K443DRAFT_547852 [Laccaria amethystina LaAM-08-1]
MDMVIFEKKDRNPLQSHFAPENVLALTRWQASNHWPFKLKALSATCVAFNWTYWCTYLHFYGFVMKQTFVQRIASSSLSHGKMR